MRVAWVGGVVLPSLASPQHTTAPHATVGTAHACLPPTDTCLKRPAGVVLTSPNESSPQHVTAAVLICTAHATRAPGSLLATRLPATKRASLGVGMVQGTLLPHELQHPAAPSTKSAHVKLKPTASDVADPGVLKALGG